MKSKINNLINDSNSILLLTHVDPDGDAVGSVLAFYHYLTSINKNVDMVILNIPKIFDFLPSINKVVDTTEKEYDLGIVLDCATRDRIGQNEDLFSRCRDTIVVDHHISNTEYGNLNYVDGNISSCCQVVYYLFKEWNIYFNEDICKSIITGVLTDTNGFGNDSVDSDTFKLASEIKNYGVNIHDVYQKILLTKTMSQYNLMKIAMERLEFIYDGKIAFTYILERDFEQVDAILGEHEGIVDIGRNISGVEVSIFIRENNGWNISLRSTGKIDVSKIALAIGGGGHRMASGAKLLGTFDEVKDTIINETKKVMF